MWKDFQPEWQKCFWRVSPTLPLIMLIKSHNALLQMFLLPVEDVFFGKWLLYEPEDRFVFSEQMQLSLYEHEAWVFLYLRVKGVWRAGAQYRTQLVVGFMSSMLMVVMSGSPYSVCDSQRDGPQLISNVFLVKRQQKCGETTNAVLTHTLISISPCLTFTTKVTVWQSGCFCPRSSTSTEWMYSDSDTLRSKKSTLWGRPSFLRSTTASKCTPSADVESDTETFICRCEYCCCVLGVARTSKL